MKGFIAETHFNLSLKIHLVQSRPQWVTFHKEDCLGFNMQTFLQPGQFSLNGLFYRPLSELEQYIIFLTLIPKIIVTCLSSWLLGFGKKRQHRFLFCTWDEICRRITVRAHLQTFRQNMLLVWSLQGTYNSCTSSAVCVYLFPQKYQIAITLANQNNFLYGIPKLPAQNTGEVRRVLAKFENPALTHTRGRISCWC